MTSPSTKNPLPPSASGDTVDEAAANNENTSVDDTATPTPNKSSIKNEAPNVSPEAAVGKDASTDACLVSTKAGNDAMHVLAAEESDDKRSDAAVTDVKMEVSPGKGVEGNHVGEDGNVKTSAPTSESAEFNLKGSSENSQEEVVMASDDSESEVEPSTLTELLDVLCDLETPGSTCAGGAAPGLPPILGLHVEGVGDVPLPISDTQAKLLASVAEQAPHGRGMETVVDTSVRNTLQINPSKVTLQNPAWAPALTKLVQDAAESLGVAPSLVRAELYKLLMYEPGGFFKKHRDTEKADGMFATLVVQLPSNFTGGSFVVSHGTDSQTFSLGAGSEAAYRCHYVCHYADCEHEIQKVESGYRLALIYSLCYTGPNKPSASDFGHSSLSSLLERLPSDESMFVLPLEHQYTEASLARLGTCALKGSDRARQKAIDAAGKGSWKILVARAERTDCESGGGDEYYAGFDVMDVELGDSYLWSAYRSDGSDAVDELKWLRKQINFESVEEGGMVMATKDELADDGEALWGEGLSGSVEYTGNEGAARETTYSMYVLIAYSEKTGFERMCASRFSSAVDHVVHEGRPDVMRRLLSFMRTKMPSISNPACVKLLTSTVLSQLSAEERAKGIETIFGALSGRNMPSPELVDAMVALVECYGWESIGDDVKAFVEKLQVRQDLNSCDFLRKADCILKIRKVSESSEFDVALHKCVEDYEAQPRTSSLDTQYRYRYALASSYGKSSIPVMSDTLVSLTQRHGWEKTKLVIQACVVRLREHKEMHEHLVQRINLFQRLRACHDCADIDNWLHDVVADFVAALEKVPTSGGYSRYGASSSLLSSNNIDQLVRILFEIGNQADFQKVSRWVGTMPLETLSKLDAIFNRVLMVPPPRSYDTVAMQTCVQSVQGRCKKLKLSELHSRYQTLLESTRGGEPVFKWCMPRASTSSPALTAFLKSPRPGPETIVVGGGVAFARRVAGSVYLLSPVGTVQQGFSATIRATSGTGQHAAVVATKTRALYDSLVKKYREDQSNLARLAGEIRELGGNVAAPTSAPGTVAGGNVAHTVAATHVININASNSQHHPAKKRRVKAPIPADAEVLEID